MTDTPDERHIIGAVLAQMPYGATMGMAVHALEDKALVCHLPFDESLIGNRDLPAIHGGALSSFMEMVATLEVARRQVAMLDSPDWRDLDAIAAVVPVPLNVTVQYLRSAKAADCYARAEVLKLGRRSNTVFCRLWQDNEAKPVASMTGVFVSAS